MANHKSAEKRVRQTERRKLVNQRNRSRLRTAIKQLRAALAEGNKDKAQTLLPATVSMIDKSVQKGVLKKNAAARNKSRLTLRVNEIGQ